MASLEVAARTDAQERPRPRPGRRATTVCAAQPVNAAGTGWSSGLRLTVGEARVRTLKRLQLRRLEHDRALCAVADAALGPHRAQRRVDGARVAPREQREQVAGERQVEVDPVVRSPAPVLRDEPQQGQEPALGSRDPRRGRQQALRDRRAPAGGEERLGQLRPGGGEDALLDDGETQSGQRPPGRRRAGPARCRARRAAAARLRGRSARRSAPRRPTVRQATRPSATRITCRRRRAPAGRQSPAGRTTVGIPPARIAASPLSSGSSRASSRGASGGAVGSMVAESVMAGLVPGSGGPPNSGARTGDPLRSVDADDRQHARGAPHRGRRVAADVADRRARRCWR